MEKNKGFITAKIYTSEDLKWDAPEGRHFKSLLISDPWRNKMSHFISSRV